jgi:hypothetical protein
MLACVGVGCSMSTTAPCTAGAMTACVCAGSLYGVQTCRADGTYAPCVCGMPDAELPVDAASLDAGSPDTGAHDASSSDAGSIDATVDASPSDAATHLTNTYVIAAMLSATTDATTAFGFDLDPGASPPPSSCTAAADFTDPYDATNTHVDNQLSSALPAIGSMLGPDGFDGMVRDQIERGQLLVVLEVSGIDSYVDDASVEVHGVLGVFHTTACTAHTDPSSCGADTTSRCFWQGSSTAGACDAAPAASTVCAAHPDTTSCHADMANACAWSDSATRCSGIASGQTFATLGDLGTSTGSITAGQIAFQLATLSLSFSTAGRPGGFVLHQVHFEGRISATDIVDGELGGEMLVSDLVQLAPSSLDWQTVEAFLIPDLMPNTTDTHAACTAHTDMASCAADEPNLCTWTSSCVGSDIGAHCQAASAGFGFAAIGATLM